MLDGLFLGSTELVTLSLLRRHPDEGGDTLGALEKYLVMDSDPEDCLLGISDGSFYDNNV